MYGRYTSQPTEYEVDLCDEHGNTLIPEMRTHVRFFSMAEDIFSGMTKDIFSSIEFLFRTDDKDLKARGDIRFHYASLVTADLIPITEALSSRLSTLQLSSGSNTSNLRSQQHKFVLTYYFEHVAGAKIGIDPDFSLLFNHLEAGNPLNVHFEPQPYLVTNFQKTVQDILAEKEDDPLDQNYGSDEDCFGVEEMELMSELSSRKVFPRHSFHNINHWCTIQSAGIQKEHEIAEKKVNSFCDRTHKMVVVKTGDRDDKVYKAFLPPLHDGDAKLQIGDKIKIKFRGMRTSKVDWFMTVIDPLPETPEGYITGHLRRPLVRVSPTELVSDTFMPQALPADQKDPMRHIEESSGMLINASINNSSILLSRRLNSIQCVKQGEIKDPMIEAILQQVTGSIRCNIPKFDGFAKLRAEYNGKPEREILGLNPGQELVVSDFANATAGISVALGPPGSGKTHLAIQFLRPYLKSPNLHKVLVVTQTNVGIDDLAIQAEEFILTLQKDHPECPGLLEKYVVRPHASEAEVRAYAWKYKTNLRDINRPSCKYRPTIEERDALKTLGIALMHLDEHPQQRTEVTRGKLQAFHVSLGWRMLEKSGIVATGRELGTDKTRSRFQNRVSSWWNDENLTDADYQLLFKETESLKSRILEFAAVVCTTVSKASEASICKHIMDTELVIIDEMPRCLEVDIVSLFVSGIKPCGYLVIGDPYQLGPYVESNGSGKDKHPFAPQLRISLQERLQEIGHPYIFLREQYRMDPRLSIDTNEIIYGSQIIDDPSTVGRELAARIETYNQQKYGVSSIKMLLDLPELDVKVRPTSETKLSMHKSRYNEDHVMYAINLAQDLALEFPEATIGIVTGYGVQFGLLSTAKKAMNNPKAGHDRISVHKIDSVQGLEFDIVILDLIFLGRGSPGFVRDPKRLNVATSRARSGMYILVDYKAYLKIYTQTKDNTVVHSFMSRWVDYRYKVDVTGLDCQFYEPGQVDLDQRKSCIK